MVLQIRNSRFRLQVAWHWGMIQSFIPLQGHALTDFGHGIIVCPGRWKACKELTKTDAN